MLWGLNNVLVSRGTRRVDPIVASFVSILPGLLLVLVIIVAKGEARYIFEATPLQLFAFVGAGVTNYLLGRSFNYISIHSIGANRSSSVIATRVLVAPAMAIVVLHEMITLKIAIGIILVFTGIFLVSRSYH